MDVYVPLCCKCFLKLKALEHFYCIQYYKTVLISWYAVSQQDVQQLHCPRNLHAIKVLPFVPLKQISQSDLFSYNLVLMRFPERTEKTGLKSAQTSSWQLFLCPTGVHFITTVSSCFSTFSENRSEIVVKAGNQMLWDAGKLWIHSNLSGAISFRLCFNVRLFQPGVWGNLKHFCSQIDICTYSLSSVTQHTKKKTKIKKKSFWIHPFFFFCLRLKPPPPSLHPHILFYSK